MININTEEAHEYSDSLIIFGNSYRYSIEDNKLDVFWSYAHPKTFCTINIMSAMAN